MQPASVRKGLASALDGPAAGLGGCAGCRLRGRCAHVQDAVLLLPMTVVGQRRGHGERRSGFATEPATTCRTCLWIAAGRGPKVARE